MFFVLFGLWLLLEGQWTLEIALTGAVLCGALWLFCWKLLDYTPRREWAFFCRLPAFLASLCRLLWEALRAGCRTIARVWRPGRQVSPRLVSFDSGLESEGAKLLLANSITLTPGTITVDVRQGKFLVHCLDEPFAEGLADSALARHAKKLDRLAAAAGRSEEQKGESEKGSAAP